MSRCLFKCPYAPVIAIAGHYGYLSLHNTKTNTKRDDMIQNQTNLFDALHEYMGSVDVEHVQYYIDNYYFGCYQTLKEFAEDYYYKRLPENKRWPAEWAVFIDFESIADELIERNVIFALRDNEGLHVFNNA